MKKIKEFIKKNEEELKVLAYGTGMLFAGVYIGRRYENIQLNKWLNNIARTGRTINNYVDGKEYMLSITEIKRSSLT